MKTLTQLPQHLNAWFFERGDARSAALCRMAYCALYLFMLWDFYPVMNLLFGHCGVYGTLDALPYHLGGLQFLLYHHDSPLELQIWFWSSFTVTALALCGVATRLTVTLTYLSVILFHQRDPYMLFGADQVMSCTGLWLVFLDSGRAWSVDQLLRSRHRTADFAPIELWPLKAVQIQVALIYLVTGILKSLTHSWQDGSATYYAIQVGNMLKGQDPVWLLHSHLLIVAMTYRTLLIELSMPFLLFYRPLRIWAIAAGVLMHTGIDVFMSIRFFSLAMYAGYLAFLEEKDWALAKSCLRSMVLWVRFGNRDVTSGNTMPALQDRPE